VPIYEYRCPNAHVFEVFKPMSAPAPERCEVCGASPVQQVLYPVAVHYKGSGFYTTDYGRSRKQASREGAEGGEMKSEGGEKKSDGGGGEPSSERKAAEA
jgi:putative FmdB family regulatory protein